MVLEEITFELENFKGYVDDYSESGTYCFALFNKAVLHHGRINLIRAYKS